MVGMEGRTMGRMMIDWLFENYTNYWGNIDPSKIGLLNFTFSPNIDFHERFLGNEERFQALLPGNPIFPADGVTGGLNEQTGYDLAAAIFAANPQIEYWWVPACLELYALGATRAAEALGIDDRVLVMAVNSDVLTEAWDNGYEGAFVACIATAPLQYAAPLLSGLVSLMNGTTTQETLWEHLRAPGDIKTYYLMQTEIITIDTYQEFFRNVRRLSGLE
jgi:ABC-type sugar transport system substrate-binding protein